MSKNTITWLHKAIMAAFVAFACSFVTYAQDLGAIEIDVKYALQMGAEINATFTAPYAGDLIVDGDVGVWKDADRTSYLEGEHLAFTNGGVNQYSVEQGKTYYLYNGFNLNSAYLLLEMNKPLEVEKVYPSPEYALSSAGYDYVDVWFNQLVNVQNATISVGSVSVVVDVMISNHMIVSIPYQQAFANWYDDGTLQGGEIVDFTLNGITNADGEQYGADGSYTVQYRAAYEPLRLVSRVIPATFYSYYTDDDASAIVRMTFDGELLQSQTARMVITYGDIETSEDDFYMETIYGNVDGNTVTFSLAGKLRSAKAMVPSGTNYGIIAMQIGPLYGADGSYVYSGEAGSMGTFHYTAKFVDLDYVQIASEFTPAAGASLAQTQEIEIWVKGIEAVTWDGVKFDYAVDGVAKEVLVEKSQLRIVQDGSETLIYVSVPEEARTAPNVVVTLNITGCTDGYDHSGSVRAEYNGLVVTYVYPADGAEIASLVQGEAIRARINRDGLYVRYKVADLNCLEGEDPIVCSGVMAQQESGVYEAVNMETYKLYVEHDYQLTLEAYADEEGYAAGDSPALAAEYVWHGTSMDMSGVEIIGSDNSAPVYYDLTGRRADRAVTGTVVIKVQGGKAVKIATR